MKTVRDLSFSQARKQMLRFPPLIASPTPAGWMNAGQGGSTARSTLMPCLAHLAGVYDLVRA
jgi:hypothetical protein